MGKRTSESQSKHDYMITSLVRYLIEQGYSNIKSSHLGHFEDPVEMPGRTGNTYTSGTSSPGKKVKNTFSRSKPAIPSISITPASSSKHFTIMPATTRRSSTFWYKKSESTVKHLLNNMEMSEVKIWTI